jgi:hypothetical protein
VTVAGGGYLQSNGKENVMRNLWKSVLGLWAMSICLGVSAPAQADAVGPYYATPSWDQTLPAATRFIVLSNFASAAVLDRETGLVWEHSPSTSSFDWLNASFHCIDLNAGGRTGWRLPTVQELLSLVDRSVSPGPTLPSGHPFTNVQSAVYWSASTAASNTDLAWGVSFVKGGLGSVGKSLSVFVWCVRGGQGPDPQ